MLIQHHFLSLQPQAFVALALTHPLPSLISITLYKPHPPLLSPYSLLAVDISSITKIQPFFYV